MAVEASLKPTSIHPIERQIQVFSLIKLVRYKPQGGYLTQLLIEPSVIVLVKYY